MNEIVIKSLAVQACVGVPDEERSQPQRLLIDIVLCPQVPFAALQDDITLTADYDAASRRIAAFVAERPRRLIETLAVEVADMLLAEFPVENAEVEIRKFILPETEYVAVRCRRQRPAD